MRLLPVIIGALLVGEPASAAKRARTTVLLLPAPGISIPDVSRVSNALTRALSANQQLELRDPDKLLVEYTGEVPTARISRARQDLQRGSAALAAGRPGEAIPLLQQAARSFEELLVFVKKSELARANLTLAVAEAEAGQTNRALSTMVRLLVWRPHLTYDTANLDPAHLPLFEKARSVVKRLRRGSVELVTEPAGARAYVNGRYVGVTPKVVFGLTTGDHFASFKLTGFIKGVQKVQVSPTEQNRFVLRLRQSEKVLLMKQTIDAVRSTLGQPRASASMVSLSTLLYIDQVIFAILDQRPPGKLAVRAFLYDLRSRLLLNQASVTVEMKRLSALEPLARSLYLNVRYDGTIETPPEPPPPPPRRRTHFYATWWFWTAVAVGVSGIVVPLAVMTRESRCPDAYYCVGLTN